MRQYLSILLAVQLSLPVWAAAQKPNDKPSQEAKAPVQEAKAPAGALRILVLEGENAVNNTMVRRGISPVVEVRDANDQPVEGATVVFQLPASGPGGFFSGQQLSKTAGTNLEGQAGAGEFIPNDQVGRFKIHVTATVGDRAGATDILQTNSAHDFGMAVEKKRRLPSWWKWAAIGAGAAVVAIIVVAKTGSSSSNPTVTINAGGVAIGQ
jgi:hypothetical protein